MSTQHTPGPWSGGKNIPIRAVDQEALGYSIIFVNTDSAARKDVARANARLIAAAPALLAELQEILQWALTERAPLRDQELKSIAAVIAKATGVAV